VEDGEGEMAFDGRQRKVSQIIAPRDSFNLPSATLCAAVRIWVARRLNLLGVVQC